MRCAQDSRLQREHRTVVQQWLEMMAEAQGFEPWEDFHPRPQDFQNQ